MPETDVPRDWTRWQADLGALPAGTDPDDWIDERLEDAAHPSGGDGAPPTRPAGDSTGFLLAALGVARSESTRRDVAATLAQYARPGDLRAADALVAAYRAARADASLGPALLAALAVLAERDPAARPDLSAALVRVANGDSRYLLVRAAKIIGRFEGLGIPTNARGKLDAWADAADPAVHGEARQQLALLALADALAEPDADRLRTALVECRAAFARAEHSEELRHDARLLGAVIDLLFTHLDPPAAGEAAYAAAVRERALALKAMLDDPAERPWPGYASATEQVLEHRIYRVAVGFARLADDVGAMADWTNFDAALTELAAAWQLMWARAGGETGAALALGAAERALVLPRIGSFLERAVGRQRLARVVERYEAAHGADDAVSRTLRAFLDAASRGEHRTDGAAPLAVDRDALVRLAATQPAAAAQIVAVVPGADIILREAGLELEPDRAGPQAYAVPIDHPESYGNDPAVDDTARPLLEAAWARLRPGFPVRRWRRFVESTVSLVKIARDLRSDLPNFVLSAAETGGKGQTATEDDLQEYVFQVLRREYGRAVFWEPTRIAGGRGDNGVLFPEGAFPIEVKAEYRSVTREHVREAYLAQPDRYATDRDRVAYLLILDLRAEHAAAESALYSLRESFYVDGLPTDPQVAGAQPNAVMVGLFPGNQPKPSSTTTYSRRPRARSPASPPTNAGG